MSCSIHLGNYIMVVPLPQASSAPGGLSPDDTSPNQAETAFYLTGITQQPKQVSKQQNSLFFDNSRASTPDDTMTPTTKLSRQNTQGPTKIQVPKVGALHYELSWLRFLKEAEFEYYSTLIQRDKKQNHFSVFEVNVDVYEPYLLKVSGRALASTQLLNLNVVSAMVSHLKIYDTQSPEAPSEEDIEAEAELEMGRRRKRRDALRRKGKRLTAQFKKEAGVNKGRNRGKITMGGTLGLRDDLEDSETQDLRHGERFEQGTFDANNRDSEDYSGDDDDATSKRAFLKTLANDNRELIQEIQHHVNSHRQSKNYLQVKNNESPQQQQHMSFMPDQAILEQQLREYRGGSQLNADSVIHTDDENPFTQFGQRSQGPKIKIGEFSIEDHFEGNEDERNGQVEDAPALFIEDELEINCMDGGNPFSKRSVDHIIEHPPSQRSQSHLLTPQKVKGSGDSEKHQKIQTPSIKVHKAQEEMEDMPLIETSSFLPHSPEKASGSLGRPLEALSSSFELRTSKKSGISPPLISNYESNLAVQPSQEQTNPILHVEDQNPIQQENSKGDLIEPPLLLPLKEAPLIVITTVETPTTLPDMHLDMISLKVPPATSPTHLEEQLLIDPTVRVATVEVQTIVEEKNQNDQAHQAEKIFLESQGVQVSLQIERQDISVGQTPEVSLRESHQLIEVQAVKIDVACGTSILNISGEKKPMVSAESQTGQESLQGQTRGQELNFEKTFEAEIVTSQLNQNQQKDQDNKKEEGLKKFEPEQIQDYNISLSPSNKGTVSSKVEITLTAEKDRPINIQVKGGEKQQLLSAISKHIFDILYQTESQEMKSQIPQAKDDAINEVDNSPKTFSIDEECLSEISKRNKSTAKPMNKGKKSIQFMLKSFKKKLTLKKTDQPVIQTAQDINQEAAFPTIISKSQPFTVQDFDSNTTQSATHLPPMLADTLKQPLIHASDRNQAPLPQQLTWKAKILKSSLNRSKPASIAEGQEPAQVPSKGKIRSIRMKKQDSGGLASCHTEEVRAEENIQLEKAQKRTPEKLRRSMTLVAKVSEQTVVKNQEYGLDISRRSARDCQQPKLSQPLAYPSTMDSSSKVIQSRDLNFNQDSLPPLDMRSSQLSNRIKEQYQQTSQRSAGRFPSDQTPDQVEFDRQTEQQPLQQYNLPLAMHWGPQSNACYFPLITNQNQYAYPGPPLQDDFEDDGALGNLRQLEMRGNFYQNVPCGKGESLSASYGQQIEEEATTTNEGGTMDDEYILAEGYLLQYRDPRGLERNGGPESIGVQSKIYDIRPQQSQHPNQMSQSQGFGNYLVQGDSRNIGPIDMRKTQNLPLYSPLHLTQTNWNSKQSQPNSSLHNQNHQILPLANSQSPMNRKQVYYTALAMGHKAPMSQSQTFSSQSLANFRAGAPFHALPQQAFIHEDPLAHKRLSPYSSSDQLKMLQNHFNYQGQPEMNRTGVSWMRTKKNKKVSPSRAPQDFVNGCFIPVSEDPNVQTSTQGPYQSFGSSTLPTALSSLQLFYPQLSPMKQETFMATVKANQHQKGSKWFDRFFQSTRNLNETLSTLHKKHDRKLRSYSATTGLSQCDEVAMEDYSHNRPREISKGASKPPQGQRRQEYSNMEKQRRTKGDGILQESKTVTELNKKGSQSSPLGNKMSVPAPQLQTAKKTNVDAMAVVNRLYQVGNATDLTSTGNTKLPPRPIYQMRPKFIGQSPSVSAVNAAT